MAQSDADTEMDDGEIDDSADASDHDGEDDDVDIEDESDAESDRADDAGEDDRPIGEEDADYLLELSALHGYFLNREDVQANLTEKEFHEAVDLIRSMAIAKSGKSNGVGDEEDDEEGAEASEGGDDDEENR